MNENKDSNIKGSKLEIEYRLLKVLTFAEIYSGLACTRHNLFNIQFHIFTILIPKINSSQRYVHMITDSSFTHEQKLDSILIYSHSFVWIAKSNITLFPQFKNKLHPNSLVNFLEFTLFTLKKVIGVLLLVKILLHHTIELQIFNYVYYIILRQLNMTQYFRIWCCLIETFN